MQTRMAESRPAAAQGSEQRHPSCGSEASCPTAAQPDPELSQHGSSAGGRHVSPMQSSQLYQAGIALDKPLLHAVIKAIRTRSSLTVWQACHGREQVSRRCGAIFWPLNLEYSMGHSSKAFVICMLLRCCLCTLGSGQKGEQAAGQSLRGAPRACCTVRHRCEYLLRHVWISLHTWAMLMCSCATINRSMSGRRGTQRHMSACQQPAHDMCMCCSQPDISPSDSIRFAVDREKSGRQGTVAEERPDLFCAVGHGGKYGNNTGVAIYKCYTTMP